MRSWMDGARVNSRDRTGALNLTVRTPGEQADVCRFRDLMSSFPTGVSVVTSTDLEGHPAVESVGAAVAAP